MESIHTLFLEDILRKGLNRALELGAEDFAGVGHRSQVAMTRFSNNSITVTKYHDISSITIYVGNKGRRMTSSIEKIDEDVVLRDIERMVETAASVKPSEFYSRLPKGDVDYAMLPGRYDKRVKDLPDKHVDIVEAVINKALKAGAKRVSGAFTSLVGKTVLSTSGGRVGEYRSSNIELNVRAFVEKDESGQGAAVSTSLDDLDYEGLGETAGATASAYRKPRLVKPGKYDLLSSGVVAGDLLGAVSMGASAFYVDSGLSPFMGKLGETVADEKLTLSDDPTLEGNPGAVPFDVEGTPTRKVNVIEGGVLETYYHNVTTAKKYGVESTGHAGFIVPYPNSVVIEAGEMDREDMLSELGEGIFITNNWYTRFQNYVTGEFSTIPRDAAFYVKGGEIDHSIKGARISDTLTRMLKSIRVLSKDRNWVKWWEFDVPSLTPTLIIDEVPVTTGYR